MTSKQYNIFSASILILATVVAVFVLIYIKDLTNYRDNMKTEKGNLEVEIEKLKLSKATFEKGSIDYRLMIAGDSDYIEKISNLLLIHCKKYKLKGRYPCLYMVNYGDLLRTRQEAVIQRYNASSPEEYRRVELAYSSMIDKNEAMKNNSREGWSTKQSDAYFGFRAAGLEGIAYASLKRSDIQAAEANIQSAMKLAPQSVSVNITRIKIGCAQHRDRAWAIAEVNNLKRNVHDRISGIDESQSGGVIGKRNLLLFAASIENDSELKIVCKF